MTGPALRRALGRAGPGRARRRACGRRAKISASSALSSVSCSSSSSTRWSRTSRFSTRIVPGLVVRGLDEPADLLVDDAGDLLGVVALVAHVAAEERPRRCRWPELDRADPLGHAVLR